MTPKLRFPLYNQPFVKKSINEILTIGSGKDYKHLSKGEIPVYGTGGLMTTVNDHLYDGESVGIGRKGTIDKPIFLKGKFWTVDTLFYSHSFEDVDPYYVFTLFQQINWKKYNEASGVPSLSKTTVGAIQVYVPRIEEQLRIRSLFEAVDQKINLLTKKKEALESYKKGLMQKIFSQELRFKREDGSDYPEWEYLPLEAFCEVIRGITYNSGNVISDGGTLVLRSTNIQSNKLDFSEGTKQFIDVTPKSKLVLKDKDIIVCMSNGSKRLVGKSAVFYQSDYNGIITAGGFCAIFRSENSLTPYLLQSPMWKRYLHIILAGSSINNLRNNEVSQLRFQVPSKEEVQRINKLFGAIDKRTECVSSQINETSEMKKGLLQQMFV